ncbi:UvrD-helicase domain-containing protein [Pseudoalteromonas piscicida]|uniref:UvrD-helicase domain-containing protein n=1 Tax=Pseudoalteromonas piscicida TaxID=43662 RepID=UPI00273974A8|nr:UvrD-helicase domain-containing protein [Pseudoalteromonas piscicida]MDP4488411.1 UvrD-helicase domain-containing protein [Pseudoalteromonas piscicida]
MFRDSMTAREFINLIYQLIALHIFSRLFHRVRGVNCSKEGLYLRHHSSETFISFAEMREPPTLKKHWLYQSLRIKTESNTAVLAIKHKGAEAVGKRLQKLWVLHHSKQLHSKANKIEQLLKHRYLSQSNQRLVQSASQALWYGWQHVAQDVVPVQLKGKLATVREIALWGEKDIAEFQAAFVAHYLTKDAAYFDKVESNPLTPAQRKACIIQDDRQLLLAAAGTGKTSVIKAKVGYLLHRKLASAEEVLLLAYGNDAATEMRQRCQPLCNTLNCSTFHSLGMQIIEAVTGAKPTISTLATDKKLFKQFIADTVQSLRQESHFERDFALFLKSSSTQQASQAIDLISQVLPLMKHAQIMGEVEQLLTQFSNQMSVIMPVLAEYQLYLSNESSIDFDDMLERAIYYVESGQFISPWKFILVDEFQDISRVRAKLIQVLLDKKTGSQLFAVGDDWQAIYRFSGGDMRLTTEFTQYFGKSTTTYLDKTFRYPQTILDTASEFICRNPEQITKHITSHTTGVAGQGVVKVMVDDELSQAQQLLNLIEQRNEGKASVALLARNHRALPDKSKIAQWRQLYPELIISHNTFHGAKGTEADFTIVFGLKHRNFPSQVKTPAFVDALLPAQGAFPDAEERRLFYVALTRAKKQCFLLAPNDAPSYFLEEIA